jgi:hypothetical protein
MVRSERRYRDHEKKTATGGNNDEFLHHRKTSSGNLRFAGTAYLRYHS